MTETKDKKKYLLLQEKIDKVYPYMKSLGWKKEDVGIGLVNIDHHCGKKSSVKICRFIDWAIDNDKDELYIKTNIAHDLLGAGSDCFSPRTSRF